MQDITDVQRWFSEVYSDRERRWDEDWNREWDWVGEDNRDGIWEEHDESQYIKE